VTGIVGLGDDALVEGEPGELAIDEPRVGVQVDARLVRRKRLGHVISPVTAISPFFNGLQTVYNVSMAVSWRLFGGGSKSVL
jgi:hypothetical protein